MSATQPQMMRCLYQTIRALADTVGLKENMTPPHQANVARIARTIGQLMNLDPEMVDSIRVGATLHDFGILSLPSEILNKPEKLTEREYSTIKQHPVHGFQMLKNIDFPWPIARMVLQHHERLDGSGYPGGLEGKDIMLEAQIIAVADVADSMMSDRPYRGALSVNEAMSELKAHRGIKYSPEAVDACIEIYTNKRELLDPGYYRS